MSESDEGSGELWLVFLTGGQAIIEEDDEAVWFSDDDDAFIEEFGDSFLDPDDAEDILAYLVDEGIITDEEADAIEIDVESLNDERTPTLPDVLRADDALRAAKPAKAQA